MQFIYRQISVFVCAKSVRSAWLLQPICYVLILWCGFCLISLHFLYNFLINHGKIDVMVHSRTVQSVCRLLVVCMCSDTIRKREIFFFFKSKHFKSWNIAVGNVCATCIVQGCKLCQHDTKYRTLFAAICHRCEFHFKRNRSIDLLMACFEFELDVSEHCELAFRCDWNCIQRLFFLDLTLINIYWNLIHSFSIDKKSLFVSSDDNKVTCELSIKPWHELTMRCHLHIWLCIVSARY